MPTDEGCSESIAKARQLYRLSYKTFKPSPPPEAVLIRQDSILQWIETYAELRKAKGWDFHRCSGGKKGEATVDSRR